MNKVYSLETRTLPTLEKLKDNNKNFLKDLLDKYVYAHIGDFLFTV